MTTRLTLLLIATALLKGLALIELGGHPLLQPQGGLDGAVYVDLARRVAGGDLRAGPDAFFVSPLYIYFLGPFVSFGDAGLWGARILQTALGTAAVGVVYATARRLGAGAGAWVAAAALALTGVVAFNEVLILQSALDPFLMALALYLLCRALGGGNGASLVLAGIGMGILALNRPNALLAGAGVAFVIALWPRPNGWKRAAAYALGLAAAVAPATIRNAAVAKDFVPISSHGGLNFYIGNHASADGTYKHVEGITPDVRGQARDAKAIAEKATGRTLKPSEVDRYFYRSAVEWATSHPVHAILLLGRKLAYVLGQTDVALNYSFAYYASDESGALRLAFVGAGILVPFGIMGLLLGFRSAEPQLRPWFAVAPLYALSVALFFVTSRYRLALLVPLAIGSGIAVERLASWIRRGERRALVRSVLALGALFTLAWWPWGLDDGRSAEATEKLLGLIDAGRDGEAGDLLRSLEATHPDKVSLYARSAQAYQVRGAAAEALGLYEKALHADPQAPAANYAAAGELALRSNNARAAERLLGEAVTRDPGQGGAWEKLGLALAALGRSEDAGRALENACRLTPESASVHLNLAVVYAQMERYDAAGARLDEALRLRPDYPEAEGLKKAIQELR